MTMSLILQWIATGIAIGAAIVFFVLRFRRRSKCCGCPLNDKCNRK